MVRKRRATRAPFSPRSRRLVRQYVCGVLLGQRHAADLPCGSPDVATRDALDRLLPSHFFVSVPAHRWFSLRQALARQRMEEIDCYHDSAIRFGGLHRLAFWLISARRAFSSRHAVCTPCLWHPCRLSHSSRDARACATHGSRQDRLQDRPRERATRETTWDVFHLAKALAPRCPFGHPAWTYPGAVALPPRYWLSTPLLLRAALASTTELGSPSTRPFATGNRASLNLGVVRRLLQPNSTRGHAYEPSILAREWGFHLATAGTNLKRVMPVALASWCVAAPGACEPRPAHTGSHRRVPLAWTKQVTGRSTRGRRARALDDSACPSRWAPGTRVTGSIHYRAWTTW